jgi:hypothetical protein
MNENNISNGIGTFLYPNGLIGTKSIDETTALDPRIDDTREIVLVYDFNEYKILVTDDCFIGIICNDEDKALDILNVIFATMLLHGVGGETALKKDLCYFRWIPENSLNVYHKNGPSERVMFGFNRNNPSEYNNWRSYNGRKHYVVDLVKKIIDTSLVYYSNDNLKDDLLYISDGYNLYYDEKYRGAYLYAWMIIEEFIRKSWIEYVSSLDISQVEKEARKDFRSWTIYHMIEVFWTINRINANVKNLLNKLRKKRNKIVHERENVLDHDAFCCLRVIVLILVNRKRNIDNPFDGIENDEVISKWINSI